MVPLFTSMFCKNECDKRPSVTGTNRLVGAYRDLSGGVWDIHWAQPGEWPAPSLDWRGWYAPSEHPDPYSVANDGWEGTQPGWPGIMHKNQQLHGFVFRLAR